MTDLFEPDAADPYPAYAEIRTRTAVCPVTYTDGTERWLVGRYDDARRLLADPRLSKDPDHMRRRLRESGSPFFSDEGDPLTHHMLTADPPEHTRLRKPVVKAFTGRQMARLRPRVADAAAKLLDDMAGRDEVDLIESYAHPLPLTVIIELLGVPESDNADIALWSSALLETPFANEQLMSATEALARLRDYLTGLIADKRDRLATGRPADDGLLTALLADPSSALSPSELLSTAYLLLISGHSSTTDFIGNAVVALLSNPDQLDLLRARPELIDGAVEELLRFDNSVMLATMRFATEELTVSGGTIPEGAMVSVVLGAANRDPKVFEDPDRLDITRTGESHLSFGHGPHYCLGAAMARVISTTAIGALVSRFPDMSIGVPMDELAWQDPGSGIGRGLNRLPVRPGGPANTATARSQR
jgi:cytochrome P450